MEYVLSKMILSAIIFWMKLLTSNIKQTRNLEKHSAFLPVLLSSLPVLVYWGCRLIMYCSEKKKLVSVKYLARQCKT